MKRIKFHYLVVIGLLLGLVIGAMGCSSQPRFQWSSEQHCLVDHSENMCYESTDEMEKIGGYDATRANRAWREAYNRARKQKGVTQARRRYEKTQ